MNIKILEIKKTRWEKSALHQSKIHESKGNVHFLTLMTVSYIPDFDIIKDLRYIYFFYIFMVG